MLKFCILLFDITKHLLNNQIKKRASWLGFLINFRSSALTDFLFFNLNGHTNTNTITA